MNKPAVNPPALTVTPASFPHLQPARRLIVLVPRLDADLTAATRRVWELANATDAHIQFLGLYSDPAQEPSLRRELVTMSAMVKDGRVSAEAIVIFGKDWVAVVKSRWQAGDTVVCFDEQRVGLSRKPLSQVLLSDLDVPLYILSGLYPQNDSHSNWTAQLVAWIGSLAIILGFLVLQVKTIPLAKDWTIVLQLLSIPVEAWSIWVWNSLVG